MNKKSASTFKAQDWEALLVGAHSTLKKNTIPKNVSIIWNKLKDSDKQILINIVSSSNLINQDTLSWNGKDGGIPVSEEWKRIYQEHSKRVPSGTSKCDISDSSNNCYSIKKYTKTTQLSSPQKAEAATLLHFALQNSSENVKGRIKETLDAVIESMTDQKYYYKSVKGAVKALMPWYNKLPQELSPLNAKVGLTPDNIKELEPLLQKEIKKKSTGIAKRMISIFVQKQKHFKANKILNNLMNNNIEIKERFLYELLSGENKFGKGKKGTASHLLHIEEESKIRIERIRSAVVVLAPQVSFELNFRPSSKLVTLMRVYLGRNNNLNLFESLYMQFEGPIEYLIEQETNTFINENLGDMLKAAIDTVTENPFIKRLTNFFTNLINKLRELLKDLLNKILETSDKIFEELPNVFGLTLDVNKLNVNLPIGFEDEFT